VSLLATRALRSWYGDFQALFGIDFDLDSGEVVAIIGANGAGKSTFLRSLTGLNAVERDSVQFDGGAIGGLAPYDIVKRGIALVPEGRRLFPSLSVEENILIGANPRRRGRWNLGSVYALFPVLKERRKAPATALSGGQQQMVAIGRALMSNPAVLLCDELSLGLAPIVIRQTYDALARIIEQNVSVVVVEQDIGQAMRVASRIYCFQEGRVSLTGKPSELSREQVSSAYFGVTRAG
jgi:branched-chain amino acid transport system ATP-binding protein